jgi:hypothetical protein
MVEKNEGSLKGGTHVRLARRTGQNRGILALLMNVNDDARRSKEHICGNGFN